MPFDLFHSFFPIFQDGLVLQARSAVLLSGLDNPWMIAFLVSLALCAYLFYRLQTVGKSGSAAPPYKKERNGSSWQQQVSDLERLILQMLPRDVARDLLNGGRTKPRKYRRVTVMFTDFKNFTRLSEKMRPQDLVEKLETYFVAFDKVIDRYGLEKIKTIGDAYMCAGGIPVRKNSNPVDVVLAAMEIQELVNKMAADQEARGEASWNIRIGIHSGEVIAGVIGKKRLAYDIWGDTVNKASKLEQGGNIGAINISERMYELIEEFFDCSFCGPVNIKNQVTADLYNVSNIKPELSEGGLGKTPNDLFWDSVDHKFNSTIKYRKAEKYILERLKGELPTGLHYHNVQHTKDVCREVEVIARQEGVQEADIFLLKTAALFHDAGFLEQYSDNEPIGVRLAREALPEFEYAPDYINVVEKLILATRMPHRPTSFLQEIICDADLDYLGREDFEEISGRLMQELLEKGMIKDQKAWDAIQIPFLKKHRYFTDYSKKVREPIKQQNLAEVIRRYKADEYPVSTGK